MKKSAFAKKTAFAKPLFGRIILDTVRHVFKATLFRTGVGDMKHILLSVFLFIMTAAPALAQSKSKAASSKLSVELHLIELERQLSDALARQDAAVLDRLWSNDLVFTFPDGQVSNKRQRLAGQKPVTQATQSESETVNDDVKVYRYGNTAVVTVLATWRGMANNQAYSSQFQATHVWAKQEGRWQLVAAHVSPVKK
jgi:ketosteroid isomerase-like protein